eukprot:scaffold36706_cov63-Phaeocystis_antarctica.AAC.1
MKACERGPYVYDSGNHSSGAELGLALGVGSTFQFKKPSLIYANAAGIGWVGELYNAVDGTDYADFFGLSDASCDGASIRHHLASGRLRSMPIRKSYVPELMRTCRQLEACGPFRNRSHSLTGGALPGVLRRLYNRSGVGAASAAGAVGGAGSAGAIGAVGGAGGAATIGAIGAVGAPGVAGAAAVAGAAGAVDPARTVLVFRFDMARSYRELLNYCVFDETFRRRFRAARELRRRVTKGAGERWIAVHF